MLVSEPRRLLLVNAPAGFGKSTLLAQWAGRLASSDTLVAWLNLDEDDREPEPFVTYLAESFHRALASISQDDAAPRLVHADLPARTALSALLAELERRNRPIVLILDDYHLVGHDASIRHFVSDFLKYTDESCHLILTLREHVHLKDIALLTARSQTIGLNQEDLAFTAADIQALLLQNYRVTVSDALAA